MRIRFTFWNFRWREGQGEAKQRIIDDSVGEDCVIAQQQSRSRKQQRRRITAMIAIPMVTLMISLQTASMKYITAFVPRRYTSEKARANEPIPINPNSTMASDIIKIWHDPNIAAICIRLDENAQCPYPTFQGRLSGPSLAILENWESIEITDKGSLSAATVHCGSYKDSWMIPDENYFVEVVALYCNDFGVAALKRRNNSHQSEWLSYNFKQDCVEDPDSSRITESFASIPIATTSNNKQIGHWVKDQKDSNHDIMEPLQMRYQGRGCRNDPTVPRCIASANDTAFTAYSFEWHNNSNVEWLKRLEALGDTTPKVCVVGFSHSRYFLGSIGRLGLAKHFAWAKAHFPANVDDMFLKYQHANEGCTRFLIGVAQWPGSKHFLFDQYQRDIVTLIENARKMDGEQFKFYFRSIHLNPIAGETGACPPSDWRTPPVMDGYSYLIQKAVMENNDDERFQFVDTRFATTPMWDSAFDWRHLPPSVSDVEALYLASVLLDVIE